MAHVDPSSARSPETPKERLTRLIAGFDDALNRVSMYGPADRVRDNWDRLKAALAADPGQGEPPQLSKDEQILLDEYRQNKCGDHRCESLRQTAARIVLRGTDTHAWAAQLVHDVVKAECDRGIQLLTTDVAAPARTVQAEQPKSCEECQHVFSAADLAAEDRDAWGHPCFGTRFLRANCESHRGTVQAEPAPQPATTRIVHSSEIADDPGGFEGDYVPLEDHRAALALQRETRVPHPPDLIEALAAYAHEAWAGWMRHLFKRCWLREGTATIPSEWRERWERQTLMPYAELPDGEKESDRKEARRMLAIVAAARQETPAVPPAPCLCTPGVRTSLCPIHGYEGMDRAASPSSVSAPSVKEGGE
jgi:hypothetical protein